MGAFKAPTPKRTSLWSSTSKICGFLSGKKFSLKKFRKFQKTRKHVLKPTKKYTDASGISRWTGTGDLTKTGSLGATCFHQGSGLVGFSAEACTIGLHMYMLVQKCSVGFSTFTAQPLAPKKTHHEVLADFRFIAKH